MYSGRIALKQDVTRGTDEHALQVTWRSSDGQTLLYDNGRLVWNVVRGKGAAIPSGGTLVIGREQDCIGGCFDSNAGAATLPPRPLLCFFGKGTCTRLVLTGITHIAMLLLSALRNMSAKVRWVWGPSRETKSCLEFPPHCLKKAASKPFWWECARWVGPPRERGACTQCRHKRVVHLPL